MFTEKITSAGFHLETDGRRLIVKPASKLTDRQRAFLKSHKAEIIAELTGQAANDTNDRLAVRPCRVCGVDTLHQRLCGRWKCTRKHPSSLSEALAQACQGLTVTPAEVEAAMSSEDLDDWRAGRITLAELQAFAEALDARLYGAPTASIDPLDVICWTPAGRPIRIQARDEAHAAWLRRMNPRKPK